MNVSNYSKFTEDNSENRVGFIVLWSVSFVGFVFCLLTTIRLLITKIYTKTEVYVTLCSMTISEMLVFLIFLILIGINVIKLSITIPYTCLLLFIIVGLFDTHSLSLAIFLCFERILALSCDRLYQVAKRKRTRLIIQSIFFACDLTVYGFVNFRFGNTDPEPNGQCMTHATYGKQTDLIISVLRFYRLSKMAAILILAGIVICLLRSRMGSFSKLMSETTSGVEGEFFYYQILEVSI